MTLWKRPLTRLATWRAYTSCSLISPLAAPWRSSCLGRSASSSSKLDLSTAGEVKGWSDDSRENRVVWRLVMNTTCAYEEGCEPTLCILQGFIAVDYIQPLWMQALDQGEGHQWVCHRSLGAFVQFIVQVRHFRIKAVWKIIDFGYIWIKTTSAETVVSIFSESWELLGMLKLVLKRKRKELSLMKLCSKLVNSHLMILPLWPSQCSWLKLIYDMTNFPNCTTIKPPKLKRCFKFQDQNSSFIT